MPPLSSGRAFSGVKVQLAKISDQSGMNATNNFATSIVNRAVCPAKVKKSPREDLPTSAAPDTARCMIVCTTTRCCHGVFPSRATASGLPGPVAGSSIVARQPHAREGRKRQDYIRLVDSPIQRDFDQFLVVKSEGSISAPQKVPCGLSTALQSHRITNHAQPWSEENTSMVLACTIATSSHIAWKSTRTGMSLFSTASSNDPVSGNWYGVVPVAVMWIDDDTGVCCARHEHAVDMPRRT